MEKISKVLLYKPYEFTQMSRGVLNSFVTKTNAHYEIELQERQAGVLVNFTDLVLKKTERFLIPYANICSITYEVDETPIKQDNKKAK